MEAGPLIEAAAKRAGCPVRGETWREGLDVFVGAFNESRIVNAFGRAAAEQMVLDVLGARFGIEDWITRHPDVAEQPVRSPVIITGLPRTGTTFLLNLLALDPQHRVYGNWEANREVPPVERAHLHDDPRIARKVAEVNASLESGFLDHRYHVEMGDEPGECVWLTGQDFKSYPWLILTPAPAYLEWLYGGADMLAAYRHHKRALQVMQSRTGGQWILKYPMHAPFLDALMEIYPDARIVFTHRDPVKPLGSSCSASHHLTAQFNDGLDPAYVGYETLRIAEATLEGVCAFEARHPDVPVHHLHYADFAADPLAEVRALYGFLQERLAPDVEARITKAIADQRALRTRVGGHRYALSEFGLDEAKLPPVFSEYVQRFSIPLERRVAA